MVHLILAVILVTNGFYLIDIQVCQNFNTDITGENNQIKRTLDQLENQESYQSSDLYKEKEFKNRNYLLAGEIVINTSSVEKSITKTSSNYIPKENSNKSNNLDLWLSAFSGYIPSKISKC